MGRLNREALRGTLAVPTTAFTIADGFAGGFNIATFGEVRLSSICRYPGGTTFMPQTNLGADADTVAYWQFYEGAGTTVADSSGNGHTGLLIGNPAPA